VSVLYMSMSLDGYIGVRTTNRTTPAATASAGCTSGASLRRPPTSATASVAEPLDQRPWLWLVGVS
jgi:hypothetical protein